MPRATLCRRHTPAGIPPRVLTGLVLAFACLTVLRGYGWVTADPGVSLSTPRPPTPEGSVEKCG